MTRIILQDRWSVLYIKLLIIGSFASSLIFIFSNNSIGAVWGAYSSAFGVYLYWSIEKPPKPATPDWWESDLVQETLVPLGWKSTLQLLYSSRIVQHDLLQNGQPLCFESKDGRRFKLYLSVSREPELYEVAEK